jgi:hypothetical protein
LIGIRTLGRITESVLADSLRVRDAITATIGALIQTRFGYAMRSPQQSAHLFRPVSSGESLAASPRPQQSPRLCRGIFTISRSAADALNEREVATPAGKSRGPMTVAPVRARLSIRAENRPYVTFGENENGVAHSSSLTPPTPAISSPLRWHGSARGPSRSCDAWKRPQAFNSSSGAGWSSERWLG